MFAIERASISCYGDRWEFFVGAAEADCLMVAETWSIKTDSLRFRNKNFGVQEVQKFLFVEVPDFFRGWLYHDLSTDDAAAG